MAYQDTSQDTIAADMPKIEPVPVPGEQFLDMPARVRAAAKLQHNKTALIDGAETIDCTCLCNLMDRTAAYLMAEGLRSGDRVASLAGNSADHVVLYLGVLAAGACMVPLPVTAHPSALTEMVRNCAPKLLFADDANLDVAHKLGSAQVHRLEGLRPKAQEFQPIQPVEITPTDLFDIIYSSGTTGTPKGIQHDARFRDRQMSRMLKMGFGDNAVSIVSTPLYSNTTLAGLLPVLAYGGTVILMRKFNERHFLELAEHHRASHIMLVPVQYQRLLADPDFDRFDLLSFKVKLSTSAPLPIPLVRGLLERWPGKLINLYGMTEGGLATVLDCGAHPDKLHTVGSPSEGTELRIIGKDGREASGGQIGEIVGRSNTIMTGYRDAPEKTREALWQCPDGAYFMRTGDMGRLDEDGFLVLLDRVKDMIISGGFNIYAADLEQALLTHPDVAEAAVIGIPSDKWGETPLGLVVLRKGAEIGADTLLAVTNAQLGKTQRLSAVEFRQHLPRNAIGKILKRDLRAEFARSNTEPR
ncbi:class I adenylate-forming enzyme family protein [Roseibium sp.]|uniref:class I adenylate-forming enzyme family protein n=1 Tax=Roseibium sp. TaxID=1936156 RepID=UPI003B51A185